MRFGLFLALLLLASCAQVGELSGGEEDFIAPVPDSARLSPLNGTTNFNGQEWIIPFNEFIQLNNPNETMVVVPPNIKPQASIQGKKLKIQWKEALLPQTTYAFYLNGTVSDITEKNDSLYTFVFSTGGVIDSLSYSVRVVDAISKEPKSKVLVGLYDSFSDSTKPIYIAQSANDGLAQFKYLKAGRYQVLAFADRNKNLLPEADENFGFLNEALQLDSSVVDSSLIRMYQPKYKQGIRISTFVAPNSFVVSAHSSLEKAEIELNGNKIGEPSIRLAKDSVQFFFNPADSSPFTLVVKTPDFTDTANIRLTLRETQAKPTLRSSTKDNWMVNDSLVFLAGSPILEYNSSLISMTYYNEKDTTELKDLQFNLDKGLLILPYVANKSKRVEIRFLPKAIRFESGMQSDTIRLAFSHFQAKDLGKIVVETSGYPTSHVVELMNGAKLVQQKTSTSFGKLVFENVQPGDYSFRVLVDENGNGEWDPGDWKTKKQAEKYIYYQERQKVRANWDLELKLPYEK
jgi:uncharacterized protein (DUF2141 family)